ncbi:MAG: hypothetical protein IT374_15250 [Polyangiaceae bacterium]|nr:hypothetical protein [Polyangiaceae bacterium]
MNTATSWGVGLALAALGVAGCSKSSESGHAAPAPPPSAAPPPASTAAAPPTPAVEVPAYAPRKVTAGFTAEIYTPAFEIVRDKGELGLTYEEAMQRCVSSGKALCTDAQWSRACEADPALAKIATWTASGTGAGRFVTRGGGDAGCRARDVVDGGDKSPSRAAVCCDRAVAIKTSNKNQAFVMTAAKRLIDYEAALRAKDELAMQTLYDEKVSFGGKELAVGELLKLHRKDWKQFPDQWALFDTCTVEIKKITTDKGPDSKLQGDCRTVFRRGGGTYIAMQRLIWGGLGMKLQTIGDASARAQAPDGTAIEEREVKERVGLLLAAD